YKIMDDNQIYNRGGDEDEVKKYAEQNGAGLDNMDEYNKSINKLNDALGRLSVTLENANRETLSFSLPMGKLESLDPGLFTMKWYNYDLRGVMFVITNWINKGGY